MKNSNVLKQCEVCGEKTYHTSALLTYCKECEDIQKRLDSDLKEMGLKPWFFSPDQRKVVTVLLKNV